MRKLLLLAVGVAAAALTGCAVVPAGPGYYGYGGPVVAAPAVVVAPPPVVFGGYYGRGWYGRRWHGR